MQEKPKRKTTSKFKKIFLSCSVFLVLCIGLFAGMFALILPMLESLTTTTSTFMEALQDEDYELAIKQLSTDLQVRANQSNALESLIEEYDARPVSWSFNNQSFENNFGQATGRATLSNDESVAFMLRLQSGDNGWKITYFEWGYVSSEKF